MMQSSCGEREREREWTVARCRQEIWLRQVRRCGLGATRGRRAARRDDLRQSHESDDRREAEISEPVVV